MNKLVGVSNRNELMGAYDLNKDGEASKEEFETLLDSKVYQRMNELARTVDEEKNAEKRNADEWAVH